MSTNPTEEQQPQSPPQAASGEELPDYSELKPDAVDDSEPLIRKATVRQPRNGEYADIVIIPSKWRRVNVPNPTYIGDIDRTPRSTADVDRTASLRRTTSGQEEEGNTQREVQPSEVTESNIASSSGSELTQAVEAIQLSDSTTPPAPPLSSATPSDEATNPFVSPKIVSTPNDATNPFITKAPPTSSFDDSKNPFMMTSTISPSSSLSPKISPIPSPSESTSSHGSLTIPSNEHVYKIVKQSTGSSYNFDIIDKATRKVKYQKHQRYTYAWGFAAALTLPGGKNEVQEGQEEDLREEEDKHVLVSIRRAAYRKDISISWYPNHFANREGESQGETTTTLARTSESTIMFTYDFTFEGRKCRWARKTLSHDLILELVPDIAPSSTISSLKEREPRPNTILAQFESNAMGYLRSVGKLSIQAQKGEGLWHDPQAFECIALLTGCVLIDLMREIVQAAIGGPAGGVAGVKTGAVGKDIGGLMGFAVGAL